MQMSHRGDIASSEAQAEAARLAEEQANPRALSTKSLQQDQPGAERSPLAWA